MPHITLEEDTILTKVLDVLKEREQYAVDFIFDPQNITDHAKMSLHAGRGIAYREIAQLITELWEETLQETYEDEDDTWTLEN